MATVAPSPRHLNTSIQAPRYRIHSHRTNLSRLTCTNCLILSHFVSIYFEPKRDKTRHDARTKRDALLRSAVVALGIPIGLSRCSDGLALYFSLCRSSFVFEWIGARISDDPLARLIDTRTSVKQVSLLDLAYCLFTFSELIACVLLGELRELEELVIGTFPDDSLAICQAATAAKRLLWIRLRP